MGIEDYKTVELPDCCGDCRHYHRQNVAASVCMHPEQMEDIVGGWRKRQDVARNGWCPKFERDEP